MKIQIVLFIFAISTIVLSQDKKFKYRRLKIPGAINPVVAGLKTGGVVIGYNYIENGEFYITGLNSAIEPVYDELQITKPVEILVKPTITTFEDGSFIVLWKEYTEINSTKKAANTTGSEETSELEQPQLPGFNFYGRHLSPQFEKVPNKTSYPKVYFSYSAEATILDSDYYFNVELKRYPCQLLARWSNNENIQTHYKLLGTGFGMPIVAAIQDHGHVIAWNQWGYNFARRYDQKGNFIEPKLTLTNSSYAGEPKLIALRSNRFLMAWIDYEEHQLCFSIIFLKEIPSSPNCFYSSLHEIKSITLSPTDTKGFAIAWIETSKLIYIQRFDEEGMKIGEMYKRGLTSDPFPSSLAMTALAESSEFIVLWKAVGFVDGFHLKFLVV